MKPAVSPAAWRADQIGGKAGLSHALCEDEFVAFEAMLEATRDTPLLDMEPPGFSHPALDDLGRHCRREIAGGRGAVILTGLDPARFGEAGYERIYWYFGRLIGSPAEQSERGDLLGYVQQEEDNPFKRGYISNLEIGFHNDYHEILSLAGVQTASEGGQSGLSPGLTVHNIMLEERPDLLAALYEGWYDGLYAFYHIYPPRDRWPKDHVPFFCEEDGLVTLHSLGSMFLDLVADERGEPIPPLLAEAVSMAQSIADRPGICARFTLQPGEMMFWHNWSILHARTAFTNTPGHKRKLMRLWLHAHDSRRTPAFVRDRALEMDRIHAGIRNRAEGFVPT